MVAVAVAVAAVAAAVAVVAAVASISATAGLSVARPAARPAGTAAKRRAARPAAVIASACSMAASRPAASAASPPLSAARAASPPLSAARAASPNAVAASAARCGSGSVPVFLLRLRLRGRPVERLLRWESSGSGGGPRPGSSGSRPGSGGSRPGSGGSRPGSGGSRPGSGASGPGGNPLDVVGKIDYRGTASAADKTPVTCREGGTLGSRFTIEITARRRIVFLHTDDCTLGDFSPGEGTRLSGIADTSSPPGGRSVWISFLGSPR